MALLETIRQMSPKSLYELKQWIETWLPPDVPAEAIDTSGFWRHNTSNIGPLPVDDPGNYAEVEADLGVDFDESYATNASILLWSKADPTTDAAVLLLAWRNFGPGTAEPTLIRVQEGEIKLFTLTTLGVRQLKIDNAGFLFTTDHGNVMRIDEDGTVHIKTGASIVADL